MVNDPIIRTLCKSLCPEQDNIHEKDTDRDEMKIITDSNEA